MATSVQVLRVRQILGLSADDKPTIIAAIDALDPDEHDALDQVLAKVPAVITRSALVKPSTRAGGVEYDPREDRMALGAAVATILSLANPTMGFVGTVVGAAAPSLIGGDDEDDGALVP